MIAAMGVLSIGMGLSVVAFAAAGGDIRQNRYSHDQKRAYAAAEAGIANYQYHLSQDQAYWTRCTNVPAPSAVNQRWNGSGSDPRAWRTIPGSTTDPTEYTIELLPANGAPQCNENNAQATMIDTASGTFKIRATGRSRGVKRSIIAKFRRKGFIDYLYFTDYETADPTWYELDTRGRPTNPDLIAWGSQNCPVYWRDGRGSQSYNGQIYWFNNQWQNWSDRCTEIQFAPGDRIRGPFHTNDEILICGSPIFGRNAQDRIEVSGPGWRGSCSGSNPNFVGTWAPNSPILTMPPSDTALRNDVDPAYLFTGRTTIRFAGNNMFVTDAQGNTQNMLFPANGLVYVQNGACGQGYKPLDPYSAPAGCADVYVQGPYAENLTIASEKDIIINGNITRTADKMLGLIANNFVRIYHPVTRPNQDPTACNNANGTMQNVQIDAAILSLQHSFTVDNYYCGNPLGTLTVNGAIAQKFRGPVGRGGGGGVVNGYLKDYNYDDRLRFRSPPYFLDPVQAGWRVVHHTEQVPAR